MRRVLIVDDEANLRWILERALSKAGYDVEIVEDGQPALDRYKTVNSYSLSKPQSVILACEKHFFTKGKNFQPNHGSEFIQ